MSVDKCDKNTMYSLLMKEKAFIRCYYPSILCLDCLIKLLFESLAGISMFVLEGLGKRKMCLQCLSLQCIYVQLGWQQKGKTGTWGVTFEVFADNFGGCKLKLLHKWNLAM